MDEKQYRYHVGEIAEYFGVSRDTLRLYDKVGILSPQKDPHNQYRVYTREDLIALDFVMRLKKINIPLEDIKMLVNDCTIERMEAMMQVQAKILEDKLEELKGLQIMVNDYQKIFSNMIKHMGEIGIEESPVFICKRVEGSMIDTMDAFNRLTKARVPKFTFVLPRERFVDRDAWKGFEFSETRQKLCEFAITMIDDEDFIGKPSFPRDQFQVILPCKCVHAVIKANTGRDYSDFYKCRDYVLDHGLTLTGDPMFRTSAIQYNNVAYYEFWAPVE